MEKANEMVLGLQPDIDNNKVSAVKFVRNVLCGSAHSSCCEDEFTLELEDKSNARTPLFLIQEKYEKTGKSENGEWKKKAR